MPEFYVYWSNELDRWKGVCPEEPSIAAFNKSPSAALESVKEQHSALYGYVIEKEDVVGKIECKCPQCHLWSYNPDDPKHHKMSCTHLYEYQKEFRKL